MVVYTLKLIKKIFCHTCIVKFQTQLNNVGTGQSSVSTNVKPRWRGSRAQKGRRITPGARKREKVEIKKGQVYFWPRLRGSLSLSPSFSASSLNSG